MLAVLTPAFYASKPCLDEMSAALIGATYAPAREAAREGGILADALSTLKSCVVRRS